MRLEPKPFQKAAIAAALRAFEKQDGSRRFLVADEVGLGKTVVARGVVEGLAARRQGPLSVFYVCSNLALARQNLERLAGFLPPEERSDAIATVDRPSLMPTRSPPAHARLRLFSLSPATALPSGRRGSQGGRVEERALGAVMLDRILPERPRGLHRALCLAASRETFDAWFKHYDALFAGGGLGGGHFLAAFREALRRAYGLQAGQHLPPRVIDAMADPPSLAQALRAALASAALAAVRPDLVILDEFQRFRDLLDPDADEADEAAARLLQAIRGGGAGGPALLLLSATPYVPYRSREESSGANSASDFYNLVAFLAGDQGGDVSARVERDFALLGEELRKGVPDPPRAQQLRRSLEEALRPLMCRTERVRYLNGGDPIRVESTELHPADMRAFAGFAACLDPAHRDWAVPLWSSVPLPLQTLGGRYQAWAQARWDGAAPAIALRQAQRDDLAALEPIPNPRLRALLKALPPRQLTLPWVAPSAPWWPLEGGWANMNSRVDGKLLIFSRYRATPTAIAGLLSYAVETAGRRRRVREGGGWEASTERSLLPADPARPNLFALFHPSPLLTGLDPLQARRPGDLAIRQSMMAQLSAVLSRHGISVVAQGPRARPLPPWQTLAALENRTGHWQTSRAAWQKVVGELRAERGDVTAGQRLEQTLDRWGEAGTETDISVLDEEEVRAVAQLALEAPGVVLARAVARHWSEERATSLPLVASLSWRGLRSYLDNPWFASTLGGSRGEHYPDAIRIAVRQGNLEAVLDEHFWYLAQTGVGTWPERLAAFASALRLRTGNTTLHEAPGQSFRLRCHAAAALTETRQAARTAGSDEPEQIRPEEVRHAFNTPFWPHVLATTSIGQEGLDFHPWCRAVAHWDLPPGPVALEQREGRVSRHAGLAVRRAIGAQLGKGRRWGIDSPWATLARLAETEWADQMGLSPWWIAPGASIQRLLLSLPGSELEERMLGLSKERALYRVALGMPDQGDLVSLILGRQAAPSSGLGELCIDLAAFADPACVSR